MRCENCQTDRAARAVPREPDPQAIQRLEHLATAPQYRQVGWDSYGALPLDDRAIAAVRRFLTQGPAIVPSNDGGLQLEWHTAGLDLEVEFNASGEPELVYAVRASDHQSLTDPPALAGRPVPPQEKGNEKDLDSREVSQ